MFAGPNGSGKSVLKSYLSKELIGVYLNPDEIEKSVREQGWLELRSVGVLPTGEEALRFFGDSGLVKSEGLGEGRESIAVNYKGKDFAVAFNPNYLQDPLRALENDEVFLELQAELSPGWLGRLPRSGVSAVGRPRSCRPHSIVTAQPPRPAAGSFPSSSPPPCPNRATGESPPTNSPRSRCPAARR